MRFPQALSNQCSSNRIHTTRLHLNTSLLSWLFNSLCYTHSFALSPQLQFLCLSFLSIVFCSSVALLSVALSSFSLLLYSVQGWQQLSLTYHVSHLTFTVMTQTDNNIVIITASLEDFFFFILYTIHKCFILQDSSIY